MIEYLLICKKYIPNKLYNYLYHRLILNFWNNELRLKQALGQNLEFSSFIGSERVLFNEAIINSLPFDSLLEIGSGVGQNFHILCKLIKNIQLYGVDIDSQRIEDGNYLLHEAGFTNVQLIFDNRELKNFQNKQFEIITSIACLLYISDERIKDFIQQIIRITKRKIILLEQNNINENPLGKKYQSKDGLPDYWSRNYSKLFLEFFEEKQIKTTKVPNPLWTTENWQNEATLFEITL